MAINADVCLLSNNNGIRWNFSVENSSSPSIIALVARGSSILLSAFSAVLRTRVSLWDSNFLSESIPFGEPVLPSASIAAI